MELFIIQKLGNGLANNSSPMSNANNDSVKYTFKNIRI